MKKLLMGRSLYIAIAAVVIVMVILMMQGLSGKSSGGIVTATVETGPVRQLISVSGVAKAEQSAELAFPVVGIVNEVLIRKGDVVSAGDTLITLESAALQADRQGALASLARAVADRDELLAGPRSEAREVTNETVTAKEDALATTIANEERKVENARRTLLSSGLTAISNDGQETAVPPTISGTYTCDAEGSYTINVYSSNAASGYSYQLSGLEFGTHNASLEQPLPMGECGLRIQFDADSSYSRSVWEIEIPNTKSSSYTSNLNAYTLAKTQAASAIALAEQDVAVARANAQNENAPARSEAVARANASVASAQAQLARIDATIADRTLIAPFSGTITEIDILPGETVTTEPVVTLLADQEFEVTARIPEIDIGRILVGQQADLIFDAKSDEVVRGEVEFISLKATEIDGVAYYEAVIELYELPPWLRSGLNADIDIIIRETATDVLRVPKRFVINTADGYEVKKLSDEKAASTTVEVTLEGNDGFVAITGLTEGDVLVAP